MDLPAWDPLKFSRFVQAVAKLIRDEIGEHIVKVEEAKKKANISFTLLGTALMLFKSSNDFGKFQKIKDHRKLNWKTEEGKHRKNKKRHENWKD